MKRSFYSSTIQEFIKNSSEKILSELVCSNPFDLNDLQRNSWLEEISILKDQVRDIGTGRILLEYTIPRMGKRVDAVILCNGIVFLLEFKVGLSEYHKHIDDQVMDYALDLKNFQKACEQLPIVPISVPTEAPCKENQYSFYSDKIYEPVGANRHSIGKVIKDISTRFSYPDFNYNEWENAPYMPTPTIVEAAQALYNNHNVEDITRSDAGAQNLTETTKQIAKIIDESKKKNEKSIVFVTGVPGAGKTLVGLNLSSHLHNCDAETHAVFLSGNLPLVTVLQEALARDKIARGKECGIKIKKEDALREIRSFIQIIHTYRDEYVGNLRLPTERIAIFDESQRAWTKDEISSFMARKKGIRDFNFSEPEFLISTMDRLNGWAVIICLVGGGQEINKGEAGLPEWFDSIKRSFPDWHVYSSDRLNDDEYLRGLSWEQMISGIELNQISSLHLANSMRSFRTEQVSLFIKQLLDCDTIEAQNTYKKIRNQYPIVLTRDINNAKKWVKDISRGNERFGLYASSNSARLKPSGFSYVKSEISPENWFLNGKDDIRSSYFLEVVASEFETQGLELDYAIVAWDADFRIENGQFACYTLSNRLSPPAWSRIKSKNNITYLKNSYRVLLTRARQGFVIYIPAGSDYDATRNPNFYDGTYQYLKKIGIEEI